jgi:hypothetical protein
MDEVTYKVPLKTLYKVVKNSSTNDSCDFQAVLLEIRDNSLKQMY